MSEGHVDEPDWTELDDAFTWQEFPSVEPVTPPRSAKSGLSVGAAALYAAMHGLAEIIQPEKSDIVIEQQHDEPLDRLGLDLTFGDLPPIEDRTLDWR